MHDFLIKSGNNASQLDVYKQLVEGRKYNGRGRINYEVPRYQSTSQATKELDKIK